MSDCFDHYGDALGSALDEIDSISLYGASMDMDRGVDPLRAIMNYGKPRRRMSAYAPRMNAPYMRTSPLGVVGEFDRAVDDAIKHRAEWDGTSWGFGDGRVLIKDMTSKHLENAIAYSERKGNFGPQYESLQVEYKSRFKPFEVEPVADCMEGVIG